MPRSPVSERLRFAIHAAKVTRAYLHRGRMMRQSLCAFLVLLAGVSLAPAQTLKDARARLLKGNYAEAQDLYTELAKKPEHRAAASIGLSKALASEGEYDKALAVVETALKELPKDADLHARRA